MKKLIEKGLIVFTLLLVATGSALAQIPDELVVSLKEGNDKVLSSYFNENIELVLPGQDDVFSKAQAQQLVARFFKENTPDGFSIAHKGTSGNDGAHYAIGKLSTSRGNFRVYFLLKYNQGKACLHQLRIEKQS